MAGGKALSVLLNISAALIAKVLSETVDTRSPLSLTKPRTPTSPSSSITTAAPSSHSVLHATWRQLYENRAVTVIGYETIGHCHQQQMLDELGRQ